MARDHDVSQREGEQAEMMGQRSGSGCLQPSKESGQQAEKQERGRSFPFSETEFSKAFQIHFQEVLNSFSSLVKTNQHNRKYAAA